MNDFGVNVITVEPSLYKTNITNEHLLHKSMDKIWDQTSPEVKSAYGHQSLKEFKDNLTNVIKNVRPCVEEVINSLEEAVTSNDPNIYYRCCGPSERPGFWFLEQFSELAQDWILNTKTWNYMVKVFRAKSSQS